MAKSISLLGDCLDYVQIKHFDYEINNKGKIRRKLSKRPLKIMTLNNGYQSIQLSHKGKKYTFLIHRLLGEYFIPNPMNLPCINHKDGNKSNNNLSNLEWTSFSGNMYHAYETNLCPTKPVESFNESGIIKRYKSAREAERDGFAHQNIMKCCKGLRKTHKNMQWRYSNA